MALGIMFHHFVDDRHPYIQGALCASEFERILRSIGPERIISPEAWLQKSREGRLGPRDICITLDDALLSQADVALPVLDRFGIKAFFFVYSSIFQGHIELFEMIRYFRNVYFKTSDEFYDSFYEAVRPTADWEKVGPALKSSAARNHLRTYDFYTTNDRIFRYVRDRILDRDIYYAVAEKMMKSRGFDQAATAKKIWLDSEWLKRLDAQGHMIGLHSNSHPTNLGKWLHDDQRHEYELNRGHLIEVLGKPPLSIAYPSGCYDVSTLAIMRDMKVEVGFCSDEGPGNGSPLEQPRLDYSLYMQRLAA